MLHQDSEKWAWLDNRKELTEELEKLKYSETDSSLANFHDELLLMTSLGGKIHTFAKENKRNEEVIIKQIEDNIENNQG